MCMCRERSEDNLGDMALSFWRVGSGYQIQVIRLSDKYPYQLSHLVSPGKIQTLTLKGLKPPNIALNQLNLILQLGASGQRELVGWTSRERTELPHGPPIDLFANWVVQLWVSTLKKSLHPLLNTARISVFVLQGWVRYSSGTWVYTYNSYAANDLPNNTNTCTLCLEVGSEPVSEFWGHRPPSDTRADPHIHGCLRFLPWFQYFICESVTLVLCTPLLFICWTILYSEMFPSVITNLVSPPPLLPGGIVGFN